MKDDMKVLIDRVDDLYRQVEENTNMSITLEIRNLSIIYTHNYNDGWRKMYLIKYKQKFMKRRISLSKSLSLIYGLEFTGFIKLERVWWWRNYIETTKYQEITYPKEGYICVVRLNNAHKHRNTINQTIQFRQA